MNKIVIMTGSFNPITSAHRKLLEEGIELVGADKGLFVCTNNDYLTQKIIVKKKERRPFILTEDTRKEMIESLKETNNKIEFGGYELGGESPSTSRTLKGIMKKYHDSLFYFLVGADKLKGIPNWTNVEEIFSNLNLIVCKRENYDIDKIISESEFLTKHRRKISILDSNDDTKDVSSSKVRELYFNGQDYSMLMDKGPYEILSKIPVSYFKELSSDEFIRINLEYGGRFSGNLARTLVYKENQSMLQNWDSSKLGDKEDKIHNTKVYKDEFRITPINNFETEFDCKNIDCSQYALALINEGLNPIVLNSTNDHLPCSGYDKGAESLEASLCQMSTLPISLYQFGNTRLKCVKDLKLNHIDNVYPLDINYGGIYSPNVLFFRNNIDKSYSLRDRPFECGVVSVSSLSNNKDDKSFSSYFNSDGTLNQEGINITKNKIRTIFRIALVNQHDSIVLGAFGSGFNGLNPSTISTLFKKVLSENEFKNQFKKVVFAIYEGKGSSRKIVGPNGKYKSLYDLFQNNI